MKLTLETLSPLWTGGVEKGPDRIRETGIIGSLRWWYEALVRGLGGKACDPTDDSLRCTSEQDKQGSRCVACELFGCTSWQRKFRLVINGTNGHPLSGPFDKGQLSFVIRLTELRRMHSVEGWLLYQALRIAAEHGAIGGKTPLKPQSNKKVGQDYGLVKIIEASEVPNATLEQAREYLNQTGFRSVSKDKWPDLRYFFFVSGQYLRRLDINSVLELDEVGRRIQSPSEVARALRGDIGLSKKIFSFETGGAERLWGYGYDAKLRDKIINRLVQVGIDRSRIRTGEEVINGL
jgi:CRISPR-associated protein Cmr1